MITAKQLESLQNYRDRAYVMNILCEKHAGFYNLIKTLLSFPIILSSSIMSIMNALFTDQNSSELKISNIVVNSLTVFLISTQNNLKITEKVNNFKQIAIKFNKLCHQIEDSLMNNMESITTNEIRSYIKDYDDINEQIDYDFIGFIKNNVKNTYQGEKTLPNVLNCVTNFTLPVVNPSLVIHRVPSGSMEGSIRGRSPERSKSPVSNERNINDIV